jgi:hypothetical protein
VTPRAPVAAALAALALAGCGGDDGDDTKTLDVRPVERGIARGVEKDNPRTNVVAVECPDDVEQRKGVVFKCQVRGSREGERAEATVTQVDDNGRVRYVVP